MTVSFALQKPLSFCRSHLFIVVLIVYAPGVICLNWSPVPMHCRLFSIFSSIRVSVVDSISRSLIHLYLSFVHDDRYGFIFILLQVDTQLCQHHLLKMLSFITLYIFCFFIKKQVFISL